MDRKIKAISVGVGAMGSCGLKYMLDHGIDVVAAVDKYKDGVDAHDVNADIEAGRVIIEADLDAVLERERPDIAFIATETEVPKIYPLAMKCIEAGVNVATISEEAFYPWYLEKELAEKLDDACKANGVTMYASGIQDVFGSAIPMALAASCNRVDRFHGYNFQPLEDMGLVVAQNFYLGESCDEANKKLAELSELGNSETRVFMLAILANCEILGLKITHVRMKVEALPAPFELDCPQWNMVIAKGACVGLRCSCHVDTEEGIPWDHSIDFAVTTDPKKEPPITEWYIDGDPNMHIRTDNMTGEVTTTASVVNRIPDIIAAEPGYKTVADMGPARYKAESAEKYL